MQNDMEVRASSDWQRGHNGSFLDTLSIDSQVLVARNGDSSIARLPDSAAGTSYIHRRLCIIFH